MKGFDMDGMQGSVIHRDQWETEDLRYICGLANAGGGTMVIAQSGKGAAGGFRRIKRPFEQIPRLAEKELGLLCAVEPVLEGAALCLEVTVPAVSEPVAYNGTYWLYNGEKLLRKELADLLEAQTEQREASWEMRHQPQGKQKDLNSNGYLAVMSLEIDDGGSPSDSIEETLSRRLTYLNLKRQDEEALTNAGVLVLHNKPESLIPGASVRLAMFDQEHGQLIRQSEVLGPISHQLMEAIRLIYEEYLPSAIPAGSTLMKEPPKEAVREALLNALVHKDYEVEMPVRVSIFPDRLIVQNPAAFADEEEGRAVLEGEVARPANPVMAHVLRLMGLMNGWGGSGSRIRSLCEDNDQAPPVILQNGNEVSIAFSFRLLHGKKDVQEASAPARAAVTDSDGSGTPLAAADEGVRAGANGPVPADSIGQASPSVEESVSSHGIDMSGLSSSTPKNAPFNVRSVAAANRLDLTATDEYVLRVLHTNGRATAVRIANVLGVSESTVRRSFRKLKEHGLVERIGSDKAGYWRVLT